MAQAARSVPRLFITRFSSIPFGSGGMDSITISGRMHAMAEQDFETYLKGISRRIECSRSGSCLVFAQLAALAAVKHGVPDVVLVQGWVKPKRLSAWLQHTWVEYQGRRIDPTFAQFEIWANTFGGINYVKRCEGRYQPEEYTALATPFDSFTAYMKEYIKEKSEWDWISVITAD